VGAGGWSGERLKPGGWIRQLEAAAADQTDSDSEEEEFFGTAESLGSAVVLTATRSDSPSAAQVRASSRTHPTMPTAATQSPSLSVFALG
jgi:hypothetical protein